MQHGRLIYRDCMSVQARKGDYAAFLGENVDDYLKSMEQPGTWGDELTLVSTRDKLC